MEATEAKRLSIKNNYKVLEEAERVNKFRAQAVEEQKKTTINLIKVAANKGLRFTYVYDKELLPDVQRYFKDLGYDVGPTSTKDTYIGWKTHVKS